jgi:hypothetical protein
MHLEWISILDYSAILAEIRAFRDTLREGTTLINAMALYFILGPKPEYYHYMKFLYGYVTNRLDVRTDEAIDIFFKNAPKNLRGKGMANAILEFLTSFAPIGSKIKFKLANTESLESLSMGVKFENTLIGRLSLRLGYEVTEKFPGSSEKFPEFVLEKKRVPVLKTNWGNLDNLGGFVSTSEFVIDRETKQSL